MAANDIELQNVRTINRTVYAFKKTQGNLK